MNTNIASRGATMSVDWEQRIDFGRLRSDRLARAREMLDASDLGALVLFDPKNIRYVTSTPIGEWARDPAPVRDWLRASFECPIEIEEGMVFALETYCAATDGRSAARIEEEVVVTKDGNRVLTRFPAEELLVAGKTYVHGADLLDATESTAAV